MLHKHALQKGKVTSLVISLPLSYRVIDCLLRTADQEKCPPQEGGSVEFQKRPKTHKGRRFARWNVLTVICGVYISQREGEIFEILSPFERLFSQENVFSVF